MFIAHAIAIGVMLSNFDTNEMAWIPIPGCLVGVAMLIGGLSLRNLWSRGWAQLGAVAGLLPVSPGWLLTGPIGAW